MTDPSQITAADPDNANSGGAPQHTRTLLPPEHWQGFDQIALTPVDPAHPQEVLLSTALPVILLLTLFTGLIVFIITPPAAIAMTLLSGFALAMCLLLLWRHALAKTRHYGVCQHELLMQYGVFWQRRISLPYTRLQHISLSQGPVERRFKLSTLRCFSAGSGAAEIELPGLSTPLAEQLRQHLLARSGLNKDNELAQRTEDSLPPAPHASDNRTER
ncbi:PH domain-containing protein [Ferrimonas pelagia]|uniref:YdbS-like PH domain-containing protein n=1 Tax=Ferrimonas pelagia TaxID=1177826 RepID=A0ABP9FRA7_9GAMM